MLAVSPLIRDTSSIDERDGGGMESFSIGGDDDCFPDFSGENLLDSIDFDDLFLGMDEEGDHVLPDLEMDPEMLAEFSSSGGEEYPDIMNNTSFSGVEQVERNSRKDQLEEDKDSSSDSSLNQGEELVSKRSDELSVALKPNDAIHKHKGRKSSSAHSKNPHGKRKVKVDWTPELHRRFVQAVEQLGVDKAVPSRILEIMGFDCLTRHNIASHLQKYRSHRKHLQAREAEAAGWSTQRRRPQHGAPPAAGGGGKLVITTSPWRAPTMGFPPSPMTPPPRSLHPHFRPLHVWGHPSPTVDKSFRHMWPKHLLPPPPYPPMHPLLAAVWAKAPQPPLQPRPPPDHSFWHSHQRVQNSVTPGTPCFPPPLAATLRFPTPPVPGILPHTMYRVDPGIGVPATRQTTGPHHPSSIYPSTECVDAAIGDVLSKPWQPLPLGLKPPSLDGVKVELQRQGVPNIPPPPTWA